MARLGSPYRSPCFYSTAKILGNAWVICAYYRGPRTTVRSMSGFKNWQALLAFGLIACPVPLLGQLCVVAALIWRARLGFVNDSHEEVRGGRSVARLLTKDEAQGIAANKRV